MRREKQEIHGRLLKNNKLATHLLYHSLRFSLLQSALPSDNFEDIAVLQYKFAIVLLLLFCCHCFGFVVTKFDCKYYSA